MDGEEALGFISAAHVCEKMGLDVIPETCFTINADGRFELLLPEGGHSGAKLGEFHENPGLRDEVTKLQFFDFLAGVGLREQEAYRFENDSNFRVWGIANRDCFRRTEPLPEEFLPPVIGEKTGFAFANIGAKDLDNWLEGHSEDEIDAAKERLDVIKRHLQAKDDAGDAICWVMQEKAHWTGKDVTERLVSHERNYVVQARTQTDAVVRAKLRAGGLLL
jgi:hypothetical protein